MAQLEAMNVQTILIFDALNTKVQKSITGQEGGPPVQITSSSASKLEEYLK